MPSKLRVAVEIAGVRRIGSSVKEFLKGMVPTRARLSTTLDLKPKQQQLEWLFERVVRSDKKMWLFREPSRVKLQHSGYKQLIQSWGFYDSLGELAQAERQIRTRPASRTNPRAGQMVVDWNAVQVNPNPQNRPSTETDPIQQAWELRAVDNRRVTGIFPSAINFFGDRP